LLFAQIQSINPQISKIPQKLWFTGKNTNTTNVCK